jgi:hypothetical protein
LVYGFDWSVFTKVDFEFIAEDDFAVEGVANFESLFGGWKDDEDAAEGFERRPGYDRGGSVDGVAKSLEVNRVESFEVLDVCYKKSI